MTPPLVPRAIVTAIAAPADYESVIGDLQEEFTRRVACAGRAEANRWYWSQALRSVPSLLSYSRASHSLYANAGTALIVLITLVTMMVCYDRVGGAICAVYPCASASGLRAWWPFFLSGWALAAMFGAVLTAIVRSQSLRLTLFASAALVASIAVPTAFGYSAPLPPIEWLLLLSVIPAMSAGSAIYQFVRRR